jgi:ribosomal protein L35AE/L33A
MKPKILDNYIRVENADLEKCDMRSYKTSRDKQGVVQIFCKKKGCDNNTEACFILQKTLYPKSKFEIVNGNIKQRKK